MGVETTRVEIDRVSWLTFTGGQEDDVFFTFGGVERLISLESEGRVNWL